MANEEALRKQAITLHQQGKKVSAIAREVGRTRQWVHKWIKRYDAQSDNWCSSQSHAPRNNHTISSTLEEKVVEARQVLEASPYLESGAYAIWHHLKEQGITPPSVATINRILGKHGLTRKKVKYQKSGIDYPEIPEDTQLMDLIGPRYLRGGQRYYLLTIISNDTRHAGVYPIPSKSGNDITQSVIDFWKSYSTPTYLQMDNELSFKGSNRHPRGLGVLIRTALEMNVIPVFIPVSEPWRNGVIERFNQHVERTLLLQEHRNFEELLTHSHEFMEQHNKCHPYSTMRHKTPIELDRELATPLTPLQEDYIFKERPELDCMNLNEIHFIRLVRSDLKINVLNTEIEVDESLMYTYVKAQLLVNDQVLLIKQDDRIVQSFEFAMPLF
jgi:transposase-like protein